MKNDAKIIFLFSVKPGGYRESGGVYDADGVAPTVKENHGEVIRVVIYEKGTDRRRKARHDD